MRNGQATARAIASAIISHVIRAIIFLVKGMDSFVDVQESTCWIRTFPECAEHDMMFVRSVVVEFVESRVG